MEQEHHKREKHLTDDIHDTDNGEQVSLSLSFSARYRPLLVIIAAVAFSAMALALVDGRMHRFLASFIGLFLVNFAMFKLIDLHNFADGFCTYDLIGKRSRTYGLAYPFIELGLGLLYLTTIMPVVTNILTLIVMIVSAAGIFTAMLMGDEDAEEFHLPITDDVPLRTVTMIETLIISGAAAFMLWWG